MISLILIGASIFLAGVLTGAFAILLGGTANAARKTNTDLARFLVGLDEPCGDTGWTNRQVLRGDNLTEDQRAAALAHRVNGQRAA